MAIIRLEIDADLIDGRFDVMGDFMNAFANSYRYARGDMREIDGRDGKPLVLEMNGTVVATGEERIGARLTVVREEFDGKSHIVNPAQTIQLDERGNPISVDEHEYEEPNS